MRHLGARLSHIGPGRVHLTLPFQPSLTQQHGYFHAGATSAIADTAGGYAASTLFDESSEVLTVEYKMNLLAPAVGDHVEAVGAVVKSGRTLSVCRLDVFAVKGEERSHVATGQQTLIRLPG
ncbi:MAG TPA: PaaI family thioesterase [Marmoricola sp.]|nr:PaaI family thioesterase [Marmoricola sp.]